MNTPGTTEDHGRQLYPHQKRLLDLLKQRPQAVIDPLNLTGLGVRFALLEAARLSGAHRILVIDHMSVLRQWQGDIHRMPFRKPSIQEWTQGNQALDATAGWVLTTGSMAIRNAAAIAAGGFDACIINCQIRGPQPELRAAMQQIARVWVIGDKNHTFGPPTIELKDFALPTEQPNIVLGSYSYEDLRRQGAGSVPPIMVDESHMFKDPAVVPAPERAVSEARLESGAQRTLVVVGSPAALGQWRDDLLQHDPLGHVQVLHQEGVVDEDAGWVLTTDEVASKMEPELAAVAFDSCVLHGAMTFDPSVLQQARIVWMIGNDEHQVERVVQVKGEAITRYLRREPSAAGPVGSAEDDGFAPGGG